MGGSTSVVKNKQAISQVKEAEVEDRSDTLPDTVKCGKHFSSDVTHICEKTEELICLNCYRRLKRLKENDKECVEIEEYMKSLRYKQTETRAADQLRNRKTMLEEDLKLLGYHEKRAASKKREMLEEIHTFVGTLVELVKHMEEELCNDVRKTLDDCSTRIQTQREHVQTWYKELLTIQKEMTLRKENTENKVLRLRTVLDCKAFVASVKSNVQRSKETSDFKLRLNKLMTLKDVVGNKNTSGHITLGEVFRESDRKESTRDVLSTINETEFDQNSLDSKATMDRKDQVAGPSKIDNVVDLQDERDKDNDDDYRKNGICGKSRSKGTVLETNHVSDEPNTTLVKSISHNEFVKVQLPVASNQRQELNRDRQVAGILQRSSSPIKPQSRRMSTPRNSANSIVSPVSVTTPSRIHLLPTRQAVKSVHGKIAVKTKTIKITSDAIEDTPNFTDSVILENGKIVFCDQRHERLILLNSRLMHVDEIKLRGPPHNIAKTLDDDKTIAVTIPDKNLIQFIWVIGEKLEEPNKTVMSKPKCRGIAFIDNNLMYTSRNDVVVVKQTDNNKPWKFDCAFREPVSLLADRQNKILYVCCIGLKSSGEVVKINIEREKIEQVLCFGDVRHPVCCSRDDDGNVYICDINPPRIHLVSRAGVYCRVVLDENEGNIQHMKFFQGSDTFLTTENNSDEVNIYELR